MKTCSREELVAIPGIGMKTASCFIMHSRENVRMAGLDVHILRFLKDRGYDVPVSVSQKKYKEIEGWFLELADEAKMSPADFDLEVWKAYREGRKQSVL